MKLILNLKKESIVKNLMAIIICFSFLSLGCVDKKFVSNRQESSKEEAIYKSQISLENYGENLFYLSVSSIMMKHKYNIILTDIPVTPLVTESSDSSLTGKNFVHIVVNKDKDGKVWLFFLNDTRPPGIVFKKELK